MNPSLSLIPLRSNALNLHNERQPNIKTKKRVKVSSSFYFADSRSPSKLSQIVWQFCCCDMMAFGQVWVKRPRRLGFRLVEVFPFWLDSYLAFIQIRVSLIVIFPDMTQNTRTSRVQQRIPISAWPFFDISTYCKCKVGQQHSKITSLIPNRLLSRHANIEEIHFFSGVSLEKLNNTFSYLQR